jgi:acetate kinase
MQAVKDGNEHAKLALDMYHYRIKKYIGAYMAALGGADAIIFTGGVGENGTASRLQSCAGLEFLGIKIDEAVNATVFGVEKVISTPDSLVKVIVVPTDEEFMIASDTLTIVGK